MHFIFNPNPTAELIPKSKSRGHIRLDKRMQRTYSPVWINHGDTWLWWTLATMGRYHFYVPREFQCQKTWTAVSVKEGTMPISGGRRWNVKCIEKAFDRKDFFRLKICLHLSAKSVMQKLWNKLSANAITAKLEHSGFYLPQILNQNQAHVPPSFPSSPPLLPPGSGL